MDTSKPQQNATAPDLATRDADAQAYAEDAPNSAIDDALARILGNPPAAECPIMVLLVDDQAIIAEAIRQALADEESVDFHYCASPEEAVQCAAETRATVILQDLVMPGTDGLTLVRQYRQNPATRDIPIIVLSTKEEPLVKSAAFAAGANDYLVKLPDRIELIARIRYHSRSYLNLLQRDEAYRALRQSQQQLLATNLELQRLTHSDGLTGLSNRRYLDQYLAAEWRRGTRDKTGLGFLMIDVDNFKAYNDTYGHVAGDEVLKQVAHTVESCLGRSSDLAARFGGEEFAVVLPGASSGGLRLLAEKIRIAIEALDIPHAGSASGVVTISIGAAMIVPSATEPVTTLIEAADVGLYRAKRDGKNQVAVSG
ncbi:MAG: two-component system, chemotaxis family, response regulator WspR [Paraburkholderia sp.]|jgi:two-component system, chemotaxis family, response regulator WspR|uniref:diguanylate cyclase n=1 Tax=Paraburkholderia sp. TaxID=1926495 RepID=UPI002AFFE767|nr:diguanylate cyclase [Paraburkholderia sp.]MEA3085368.1 two-component system, chemotaxis family, response regulator WspR [Paraburkholderia sp.]MEA3129189.1 two-component system, chemotaxis family, response regulator WspR [Paraburkholderia sp.]